MNEAFFTLIFLGLVFVLIAAAMRGRAWMSKRVGDSTTLRRMEREALRYFRITLRIGVAVSVVGLVGWLFTR